MIEKKSRFLASAEPVKSEEEAQALLERARKKYWDASHNCYAYIIGTNSDTQRYSDDGEPGGTAGRPILDVLNGQGLTNVLVVVTRYFGGTLLGTGGLVRAYSKAAQAALNASVIIEKLQGFRLVIRTDYNGVGKIQYILGQQGIPTVDSQYTDSVLLTVLVSADRLASLKKALTEATSGRADFPSEEEICFAEVDGEPIIFEDS